MCSSDLRPVEFFGICYRPAESRYRHVFFSGYIDNTFQGLPSDSLAVDLPFTGQNERSALNRFSEMKYFQDGLASRQEFGSKEGKQSAAWWPPS